MFEESLHLQEKRLEEQLARIGYVFPVGSVDLRSIVERQGWAAEHFFFEAPDLSEDGIRYTFSLERLGNYLHLNSVTLEQQYSFDGGNNRAFSYKQTYFGRDFAQGREATSQEFRKELADTIIQNELWVDQNFKTHTRFLGYDPEILSGNAHLVYPVGLTPVIRTYERVAVDEPSLFDKDHFWIMITLNKDQTKGYTISSINAAFSLDFSLNQGDHSKILKEKTGTGLPPRDEIVNELLTEEKARLSLVRAKKIGR